MQAGQFLLRRETLAAPNAVVRAGTLSFTARSTVGDFVGTTTAVRGSVIGNADLAKARGWVEAPVTTLSTGNRLRDRDLRAAMEVAKYPTMHFALWRVSLISFAAEPGTQTGALHGALTVHGVTRTVAIPATLIVMADTIDVGGTFTLNLADYEVGGLTRLFGVLRVQRNIDVRFRVLFEAEAKR